MASKLKKNEINADIYNISTIAAGSFTLQEVLDSLAKAAVEVTGAKACSIRLLSTESNDLAMRSTYGLSDSYRNKGPVTPNDPVIKLAFSGEAVIINDMMNDARVKYPIASQKEGLVGQLTVAMVFRDKPIGVLRLYSGRPNFFSQSDIDIARLVATQCAVAITNAKLYSTAIKMNKMQSQMDLAGTIQRRMIPSSLPAISGLDIAASYRPCYAIGGDFYDFTIVNDDTLVFLIADVMGKGIPAAMMMSMFRGGFKALTECCRDCHRFNVKSVAGAYNDFVCSNSVEGEFITAFVGIIEFKKGTLSYTNCGHEPGILLRNGSTVEFTGGGPVLGLAADSKFETISIELNKGDMLLFYTDGLVDAVNYESQLWGRERLNDTVLKCTANMSAETAAKTILNFRRRFTGLLQQPDDTSIVAIRVTEDTMHLI
ncbi:MAG: PP2C family protein-serine/threonine phosphatase [Phycisphaerae bacterium]|jgi:sigma-B regulation protein RsbU (phosphoserine phosphatase)